MVIRKRSQLGKTIKPSKCFYHLISLLWKSDGSWVYESNEEDVRDLFWRFRFQTACQHQSNIAGWMRPTRLLVLSHAHPEVTSLSLHS
jgi:hypothetical protein